MRQQRPYPSFSSKFRRYFWVRMDSSQLARLFVNACGVERNSRVPSISQRFRQLRIRLASELFARGVVLPQELRAIRFNYPFPVNAWHQRIQKLSNISVKARPTAAGTSRERAAPYLQRT